MMKNRTLIFLFTLTFLFAKIALAQSWKALPLNVKGAKMTGLHVSKSSALVASTYNKGIFRSTNNGMDWTKVNSGSDTIFSLYALTESFLLAGGKGAMLKSLDSGKTWTTLPFPKYIALSHLQMLPSGILAAGTGSKWDFVEETEGHGIWFSPDTGKSWQVNNKGIVKEFPLVESMALLPDGGLLAGIYKMSDFEDTKYGVMILSTPEGTWERLKFNITGAFKETVEDSKLMIEHVNALYIQNDIVYATILGAYTNFAIGLTVSKPLAALLNNEFNWQLVVIKDSVPADGGFFDLVTNRFTDSKGNSWTSLQRGVSGIESQAYEQLVAQTEWINSSLGLPRSVGNLSFAEDKAGNIFSFGYFTADTIYTRLVDDPITKVSDESRGSKIQILTSPNPVNHFLKVYCDRFENQQTELSIYNSNGLQVYSGTIVFQNSYSQTILAETFKPGIYYVQISNAENVAGTRFLKE